MLAANIDGPRTGHGQYMDTSLLEASAVDTNWPAALALDAGISAEPMGSAHPAAALTGPPDAERLNQHRRD